MHHSRPTISRVGINNVAIAGRNHHLTLLLPTFLLPRFVVLVELRRLRARGRRRRTRVRWGRLLVHGGGRVHEAAELRKELLLEAEVGEGVGAVASHSRGAASEGGRRGEGIAEAAEEEEGVGLAEGSLIGDGEEDKGVDHEQGVNPAAGGVGVVAVEARH